MNHRTFNQAAFRAAISRWTAALAILCVVGTLAFCAARLYAESANSDFKQGQAAEAREDYDTAFELFQKAYNRNPKDARFKIALARIRTTDSAIHVTKGRKLFQAGDMQGALSEFLHAAEIDPGNEAAQQEIAHVRQKQGAAAPAPETGLPEPPGEAQELDEVEAPPQLHPLTNEPLTLHYTEDAKVVYQAIGKAAGINVLFDPDFNSKRIQVELNGVSLLDALRIVGVMSDTFWRPVTSNTIFVAQNSRTKRQELNEEAVQTFYLTNAWQQNDLNDVQTALRNVMPEAKVYGVQSQNAIVMRATPDELLLAQQLIDDLDKPRGEVVVDIAVLEVSKNWERSLGISWPSSFGVSLQPNCAANNSCSTTASSGTGTGSGTANTVSPTLYNLAHLNSTDFAVNVGSATLNLLLTDNNTKVLQSPRIRATDGQKQTMKIGSRIPIATGSYQTGAATALVSSLVNTQFQYQDVGVNIEMTPSVHYDHDVTLKMKIEVSAESGTETISGVTEPIISQRVVDQVIRLREGEASILGGIQNNQEQNNWNGIPGLSAIPVLKYLFGSRDRIIQDDDIVFVVVPHIVRSQELDEANLREIDTGTGQSIDLRYSNTGAGASASAPVVQPAAMNRPTIGSMPAGSAVEAAPQMLAQLRSDMASSGGPNSTAQTTVTTPNAAQQAAPPAVAPAAVSQALQQAAAPTPPPVAAPPTMPPPTMPATAPAAGPPATTPGAGAAFAINAPAVPPGSGATFQVPIILNGATDVASIALQFHYDTSKLQLVNVAPGDLLSRDGQAAPPIHDDEPAGNLVVGISRPPGTHGITGSGTVCVLTFQAKASGPSDLAITRASVVNGAQQQLPVASAQTSIVVK
ncbi:MAG TPA: cohesin domain-containing protein [Terracidiphilus sp.]|nr:cohesin domain-containing protein [Terracidiphilus sp.]